LVNRVGQPEGGWVFVEFERGLSRAHGTGFCL
jgi:hypothetical protein